MNYSYVLLSERDGRFYIGSTGDLRARMEKHKSAQCILLRIVGL